MWIFDCVIRLHKGRPQWKKNVFFRALPESPKPSPMTPIRATWSSFFGSQNSRFESQFRTKNTICFFSWPYPSHVFRFLGPRHNRGMGFQNNWYYALWSIGHLVFGASSPSSSWLHLSRQATSCGRGDLARQFPLGYRRAAVNRIVPPALVHNLYSPLVTACQGLNLFWCCQ